MQKSQTNQKWISKEKLKKIPYLILSTERKCSLSINEQNNYNGINELRKERRLGRNSISGPRKKSVLLHNALLTRESNLRTP